MLSELRRIRPAVRAAVVLATAVATFGLLSLAVGSDDPPSPKTEEVSAAPSRERPIQPTDLTTIGPDGRPQGETESPEREAEGPADLPPAERRRSRAGLARLVGMKVMTPMIGTAPSAELLGRVRRGEVGGVILFGENVRSPGQVAALTAALQDAARAGGGPPLLIATDQEGGIVKRFPAAPPSVSAEQMGAAGAGAAREQGLLTGQALRRAGVNVDLAPVADVKARANFLGSRTFGSAPGAVATAACAFADGLRAAGVAGTLKHFPGLGYASGNTDAQAVAISAPPPALRAAYAPYRRCASRAGLVMLSNAVYPSLDGSGLPAVLSQEIVQRELRGFAGFDGVTVSDAFGAPGPAAHRDAAVTASRAGVDLFLWGPGQGMNALQAYRQMRAAARSGRLARSTLNESAARLRRLREELGG